MYVYVSSTSCGGGTEGFTYMYLCRSLALSRAGALTHTHDTSVTHPKRQARRVHQTSRVADAASNVRAHLEPPIYIPLYIYIYIMIIYI